MLRNLWWVRSIIRILAVLDIDPSLCLTVVSTCFVAECAVHSHSLCQQLCVLVGKASALLSMINNNQSSYSVCALLAQNEVTLLLPNEDRPGLVVHRRVAIAMVMKLDLNNLHVQSPFRSPRIIEDERRCSQRSEGRPRSRSKSMIQSFAMT